MGWRSAARFNGLFGVFLQLNSEEVMLGTDGAALTACALSTKGTLRTLRSSCCKSSWNRDWYCGACADVDLASLRGGSGGGGQSS